MRVRGLFWAVLMVAYLPLAWGGDLLAGDVFKVDGKLYLHDLYTVRDRIMVGDSVAPLVLQAFEFSNLNRELRLTEQDRDVLLNKLTDLQTMEPNLGLYLIDGSRFFSWNIVNAQLVENFDSMSISLPAGSERLMAAIRSFGHIYIEEQRWNEMDSITRAGLIIHELLYAMLVPQCEARSNCYQDPQLVHQLVSKAFSPDMREPLTAAQRKLLNGLDRNDVGWSGTSILRLSVFPYGQNPAVDEPVATA